MAYENNAKIHTEKQIEHIANSIRDFGFNDPIGVWTNTNGKIEIVTGHGAVQAAQTLGMKEIPCNFLDHMSDEERRAYCHVHNQTQLETGFEVESLIEEMDNLDANWDDYGFEGFAFDPDQFGTEFELNDADAPLNKSLTLQLTQEQYDIVTAACDAINETELKGGNNYGDKVCEVCKRWAER